MIRFYRAGNNPEFKMSSFKSTLTKDLQSAKHRALCLGTQRKAREQGHGVRVDRICLGEAKWSRVAGTPKTGRNDWIFYHGNNMES